MASVNVLMSKKGVTVQRGEVGNHRAQGIVERLVGKREKKIAGNARVSYLYAPGEAENDTKRLATDPTWSIKTYYIKQVMITENQPVLYYLENYRSYL